MLCIAMGSPLILGAWIFGGNVSAMAAGVAGWFIGACVVAGFSQCWESFSALIQSQKPRRAENAGNDQGQPPRLSGLAEPPCSHDILRQEKSLTRMDKGSLLHSILFKFIGTTYLHQLAIASA